MTCLGIIGKLQNSAERAQRELLSYSVVGCIVHMCALPVEYIMAAILELEHSGQHCPLELITCSHVP